MISYHSYALDIHSIHIFYYLFIFIFNKLYYVNIMFIIHKIKLSIYIFEILVLLLLLLSFKNHHIIFSNLKLKKKKSYDEVRI